MNDAPPKLGPFQLLRLLGRGSMGDVWLGRHLERGFTAAIKLLHPELAKLERHRNALVREVQAAAGLEHPNIVNLLDSGTVSKDESAQDADTFTADVPWFAMELAHGGNLVTHPPNDWPALRRALGDVLRALAHAHAREIIHRDLKPANLLWSALPGGPDAPRVLVADFGIAHSFGEERPTTTVKVTAAAAGTPYYMSPEQLLADWRDYGPWTDLYSLGCVAYELATGAPPFDSDNLVALGAQHVNRPPPPLVLRFPCPDGFSAWVMRLLKKRPAQRYQRAADALWALERLPASLDREEEEPTFEMEAGALRDAILRGDPSALGVAETVAGTLQAIGVIGGDPARPPAAGGDQDWSTDTPPMPASWSQGLAPLAARAVAHSAALLSLREAPFVGRFEERDLIWSELARVRETRRPGVVLIDAAEGLGASRLCSWMTRRAEELGAAEGLRVSHSPAAGPREGLPAGLARRFGCAGLPVKRALRRMEAALERLGWEPDDIETAARRLVGLTHPLTSEEDKHITSPFPSSRQRNAFLLRLLAHISSARPLVIWLDEAHLAADALGLVHAAIASEEPLAALFLLSFQRSRLSTRPLEAPLLGLLAARPNVANARLRPLAMEQTRALVGGILPLEPGSLDRVAERSEGVPLMAIQLLHSLFHGGALLLTRHGYQLPDDNEAVLPDTLHDVWKQRIEAALELYGDGADAVALDIAAVLGQTVDVVEWNEACAIMGVPAREELIATFAQQGLIQREKHAFSFAHGLLCESILRRAEQRRTLIAAHRACAAMLIGRYTREQAHGAERAAEHLLAADMVLEALRPLTDAIYAKLIHGELESAQRLLARLDELMRRAGVEPSVEVLHFADVLRAIAMHLSGEFNEAFDALEKVLACAPKQSDAAMHALLWSGRILDMRGQVEAAAARLREVQVLAARRADHRVLSAALRTEAFAQLSAGRTALARSLGQQAWKVAHAHGVLEEEARSWHVVGRAHRYEGNIAAARKALEGAIGVYERMGNVHSLSTAYNDLGELARCEGDYQAARDAYSRALKLTAQYDTHLRATTRLNLILARLQSGERAELSASLDDVSAQLDQSPLHVAKVVAALASAVCLVVSDLGTALDRLARAYQLMRSAEVMDPDIGLCLRLLGDELRVVGRREDARDAYAGSLAQFERLGDAVESVVAKQCLSALERP